MRCLRPSRASPQRLAPMPQGAASRPARRAGRSADGAPAPTDAGLPGQVRRTLWQGGSGSGRRAAAAKAGEQAPARITLPRMRRRRRWAWSLFPLPLLPDAEPSGRAPAATPQAGGAARCRPAKAGRAR